MKQIFILVNAIIILLVNPLIVPFTYAKSGESATTAAQKKQYEQENKNQANEQLRKEMDNFENLREPVIQSASSAIDDVAASIALINEKKYQEALKKLQQADGKIDTAIAAEPDLAFITVASEIKIFQMLDIPSLKDNNERIKRDLAYAEDLLDDGNVQAVRNILMNMRDEVVISHTSLPLATYPSAIKKAVAELSDDKHEEAQETLETAMDTLIITKTVIPLPVYNARNTVDRASKMDKSKKEKVLSLLDYAQMELNKAELLGYLHEDMIAYENIEKRIEELRKEIQGQNKVAKYYDQLKSELNELWQDITGL